MLVLHHKHTKLFEPFTLHITTWSVRKGFNQSICRMKEQKTTLQCLAWLMLKSVISSGAMKSTRIWQC